jgi:hypothetical protein
MLNYDTCSLYYAHDGTSETADGQCDYVSSFVSHKVEAVSRTASFYASHKQTII